MQSGVAKFLQLCLQLRIDYDLISDAHDFFREIFDYPGRTGAQKCLYIREFMFTHSKVMGQWTKTFKSETYILNRAMPAMGSTTVGMGPMLLTTGAMLDGGSNSNATRHGSQSRRVSRGSSTTPSRARTPQRDPSRNVRPRPARTPSDKFCWAYVYQDARCSRNDCVFVHTCASCGGNHTAADCRAYDRSKAEAAAISRGGQTRRPENRR